MTTDKPPTPEREEGDKRRLEGVLPEIVKRLFEAGYEKLSEGPESVRHFVSELKLPKDALMVILSQLDETKNGLYRAVAKEVRDFLEHTNFADELARVLTKLSFEVKTEVRFIPNDKGTRAVPDIRSKVSMKRDSSPSPAPDAASTDPQEKTSQAAKPLANADASPESKS